MDSTQAKHLAQSIVGRSVAGWLIEKEYGFGKSAVVMAASKDGVSGAVKVFHPELVERYGKPVQLERISREKALIGADHPNLVRILDGGECEQTGHLFVVMEPIPHPNLKEVLASLPDAVIPKLIAQVASAARFLEDRNLVHRDIKPENIAITHDFSRAILLDLGVLRPIGLSDLTDVDQRPFIGTLRYSSPEFLRREEQDSVSGWRALTFYQLGAVLHDMLMRRQLFDEVAEPYSLLVEAVKSSVPKIAADDVRLVGLANRCLLKNPATRIDIVSWTDFHEGTAPDGSAAVAARERIKQKQKYFQAAAVAPTKVIKDERRSVRLVLDDFCNRFESRVAALINDLQCFPLRTTQSEKDIDGRRCLTCIHFDRDVDLGLESRLTILFECHLADMNNGAPIFKVSSSAALSKAELTSLQLQPSIHFVAGDIQEILDSKALEARFTEALERAYQAQDKGVAIDAGDIIRLDVQE